MLRIFSIVWLAIRCASAQDKVALMVEVLQSAADYEGVISVKEILQREGSVFRFVPSIPCVKCICITFAITNNILSQIYQITIIWNNLSSIISNNQAQKKQPQLPLTPPPESTM